MSNKNNTERKRAIRTARLSEARILLGSVCAVCEITENLQFDHIDPSTKKFDISCCDNISVENFWLEVKKCQLLCVPHHVEKCVREGSIVHRGTNNGNSKLTEFDVRCVRELRKQGISLTDVSYIYGVTKTCISDIDRGRTWSWLV